MKDWQFNVLFLLACGGAIVLLLGEEIGVTVKPEVVTVFGAIMAFVLTQQRTSEKEEKEDKEADEAKPPARQRPRQRRNHG